MADGDWVSGQAVNNGTVTSGTVSPGTVTATQSIVVSVRLGGTTTVSTISDNLGNTYVLDEGPVTVTNLGVCYTYHASADTGTFTAGTPTITVTNASATQRLVADIYQGNFRKNQSTHATGTGADPVSLNSGNITTTQSCTIYGGLFGDNGGAGSFTAGTGFTIREQINPSGICLGSEDRNGAQAAGTYSATATGGGSNPSGVWCAIVVGYQFQAAPTVVLTVPPAPIPAAIFLQQMQLEGVLYAPPATASVEHIASDYLYLTDTVSRSAFTPSRPISDVLGYSDVASPGHQNPRSISDTLGLTDTVTRALNFPRTNAENLGLVDAAVANVSDSRQTADTLGLTDTVVTSVQVAFQSQIPQPPVQFLLANLGLPFPGSPTIYVAQVLAANVSDNLGLADTASANLRTAAAVSDVLGLTDTVAVIAPFVTPPPPPIPPVIILRQYSLEAFLTQPVPPTNPNVVLAANVNDQLGLTNTTTAGVTVARGTSENLGLADTATAAVTGARSDADTLGLADTAVAQLAAVRTVSDLLGLIDAAARKTAAARGVSEHLGFTDTASGPPAPGSTSNLFIDLNTGDLILRI